MNNKKLNVLLGFAVGIIITLIVSVGYIGYLINDYENKISTNEQCIDQLTTYYNNKVVELGELETDYTELENQIYNIVEGEEYDVSIKHGEDTIIYKGKKEGLFDTISKTKIVVH